MAMRRTVATYEAYDPIVLTDISATITFMCDAVADISALADALGDLLELFDAIDGGEHDDDPALVNARALLA